MSPKAEKKLKKLIERKLKGLKIIFRKCEQGEGHRKFDDYFDAVFLFAKKGLRGPKRKQFLHGIHENEGCLGRKSPASTFREILDLTCAQKGSSASVRQGKMISRWDRMFRYVEDKEERWKDEMTLSEFIKAEGGPTGCARKFRDK
jgi:hypothetical protein